MTNTRTSCSTRGRIVFRPAFWVRLLPLGFLFAVSFTLHGDWHDAGGVTVAASFCAFLGCCLWRRVTIDSLAGVITVERLYGLSFRRYRMCELVVSRLIDEGRGCRSIVISAPGQRPVKVYSWSIADFARFLLEVQGPPIE